MRAAMVAIAPIVGEVGLIQREAELAPVAGQHGHGLVALQRVVRVGEADAAVELRVAFELALDAGHSDQDDAQTGTIEDVPDVGPYG